eukprot:TRINITY_DN3255_c0_g2_i3.p1 TRINITY_DN3255_c0_g2~~TRINITY_DN3255_c0_g2_i3.p1  ORF type:complete len:225 (-),score=55.35 TRINITY_DN3255_c0_g2_i3:40-714(-)
MQTPYTLTIVRGSEATRLPGGKKAPGEHTHSWKTYIRGPAHEDITRFIYKVVFHLHDSFSDPIREVLEPPYETSATGWGEFTIKMSIYLQDQSHPPIDVLHNLMLFPRPVEESPSTQKVVTSEFYEDLPIYTPSQQFINVLTNSKQTILRPDIQMNDPRPLQDEMEKYALAESEINLKISDLVSSYKTTMQNIAVILEEIAELEQEEDRPFENARQRKLLRNKT